MSSNDLMLVEFVGMKNTAAGHGNHFESDDGREGSNHKRSNATIASMTDVFPAPGSEPGDSSISSDWLADFSLHQAAREGAVEVVKDTLKRLCDDGIDVYRIIDVIDNEGSSPLHHAARHNRKNIAELLIDNHAHLDVAGEDQNTPLHLAAKYNSIDVAKILIQRGAAINIRNVYGTTPLHFSARRGNKEVSKLLINQKGIQVNQTDNGEVTPLHQAAVNGNIETCKMLIAAGANITACDSEGELPLHYAAAEGNENAIQVLVDAASQDGPADEILERKREYVNHVSNEQDTALHLASQGGYVRAVEVLIDSGADVNVKADDRNTPLHLAAVGGHLEVAQKLLLYGAKINVQDAAQMTPLHKASIFGKTEMMSFLVDRGAKLNLKDRDNFTPLLCAVWKGQRDAVEYLISKNANLHLTDANMKTCLHIAVENSNLDTLELLLEKGASSLVNVGDKDYKTPMHYAAATGQVKAIENLLGKGGKADLGDNDERTPLHIAALHGKPNCAKLLGKSNSAVLNSTDERGRTALHLAAKNGHHRVLTALIELGAEIDGRDDVFWTPLDYAARYGFYKTLGILLDNDAPVDASDKNKNTPLHLASAHGHVECVNLLLDYNANIAFRNIEGKNCLDLAVEHYERDVCMALVTHRRWIEAIENKDLSGRQPLEKLIEVAPEVAEFVLDKCIEYSKHPVKHPEYHATYTFKYLEVNPDHRTQGNIGFYAPKTMVDFKRESLLSHPVTRKFVDVKWQLVAKAPYFANLILYLLFVALLTAFAVIERNNANAVDLGKVNANTTGSTKTTDDNNFTEVVPWLLVVLCIFNLLKEVFQVLAIQQRYFKDLNNYLELILYTSTFIFMLPFLYEAAGQVGNLSDELRWSAAAISVLFGWINLLLFLQRYPYFGLFVVMFIEILKTVLKVLSVFAIFIIAFALSFFVLMSGQKTFKSPEVSFMKVLVMTIGELEYDSVVTDARGAKSSAGLPLLPYADVSYVLFAIFLVLMPIIIMNLLVGLAVGDIESVRKSSYLRILELQVDLLQEFESILPRFYLRRCYRPSFVFYPNALPWYERLRIFFGFSDDQYESLKRDDSESAGREELILKQLGSHDKELQKQKKRLKHLTLLVEEQCELLKQMASKMGVVGEEDA